MYFLPVEIEDEDDRPRPPPPEDSIATRCRLTREHGKLTRWAVNGAAGLTRGHYGRIEKGWYRYPDTETCMQLVLGFAKLGVRVTLDYLLMGAGKGPTRIRKKPKWNQQEWKKQQAADRRTKTRNSQERVRYHRVKVTKSSGTPSTR